MAGYLDEYGVADARREAVIKKIILAVVIVAAVAGTVYFLFRDYREKQKIQDFVKLLEKKDYKSAYALWGCVQGDEAPCRDYRYEKFLEDWGPDSDHPDISAARITRTRSCAGGIIQTLQFGKDDEIYLYVDRGDRVISFAPWPVCNPRIPASSLKQ